MSKPVRKTVRPSAKHVANHVASHVASRSADKSARSRTSQSTKKNPRASETRTQKYDTAALLRTDREIAAYLEAALSEGDAAVIAAAIGDIARARGMTKIAHDTGLGRESLYKALSTDGKPEFNTVMRVLNALNIRLHATLVA